MSDRKMETEGTNNLSQPDQRPARVVADELQAALEQARRFNKEHTLRGRILDGYRDAGRFVDLDPSGRPISLQERTPVDLDREIVVVDRTRDTRLAELIAQAQEVVQTATTEKERAFAIARLVYEAMYDPEAAEIVRTQFEQDNAPGRGQEVLLGDVSVENGLAGVCRHRALLFQILAADVGLNVTMRRGAVESTSSGMSAGYHIWNELEVDGKIKVVDLMHPPGDGDFSEGGFPEAGESKPYRYFDLKNQLIYQEEPEERPDDLEDLNVRYQERVVKSENGEQAIQLIGSQGEIVNLPFQGKVAEGAGGQEVLFQDASFDDAQKDRYKRKHYPAGQWTYVTESDPKNGKVVRAYRISGVYEQVGDIRDPLRREVNNPANASIWLEAMLRRREKASGYVFSDKVKEDLINTITGFTWLTVDEVEKLVIKALARMRYHNASIKAKYGLDGLVGEVSDLSKEEHSVIFDTKGVEQAVNILTQADGDYFRLNTAAADAADIATVAFLRTAAGGGCTAEEAELALELAKKAADLFGVSSYYDGIRGMGVGFVQPPAAIRTPPALAGLTREQQEVAMRNYRSTIMEWYAAWFEQNYDTIDLTASFTGQGAGHMRAAFYYPVRLRKENEGQIDWLKRYAYLWVTDAVHYYGHDDMVGPNGLIARIRAGGINLTPWAVQLGEAHKNRKVFFDKGDASILNRPLVEANTVKESNADQTVPKVLANYKSNVDEGYKHVGDYNENKRAKAHVLRGILRYANSADGRRRFRYLGWGRGTQADVIAWAVKDGEISQDQARVLARSLGITTLSLLGSGGEELGSGLGGALSEFFKGIGRK